MATHTKRRKDRLTPTQARTARRERRKRRKRFTRFGIFIAIGVVSFLFVVSLFAPSLPFSIGSGPPTGPGVRYTDQGADHIIEAGETHTPYNSIPATSGWHYSDETAPASWGVHEEVLPDEVLVHNLKLGGVGIHYDCPEGCDELVADLAAIAEESGKVVMSPYSDLGAKIALTAWTFLDKFDEYDEARVRNFVETHVNSPNAPEPDTK